MKQIILVISILLGVNFTLSQNFKKIDQLLTTYEKNNQFSGSVLVAEKGKILFERSYGYKNAEKKQKNTNNSQYRIFSTTKLFTATVIIKLAEERKLSLDDKLSKYYPNFPKGDSITIKNILSHTSGIPEADDAEFTFNDEILLKHISAKPLDFSPGKSWNYSNTNYYLLGFIIKKASGLEYDQAIEKYILRPLNMNQTGFHFNDYKGVNKAFGYEFIDAENSNQALQFKSDHPFAAGAMYSSVEDLYKFSEAFYHGKIISIEDVKLMHTPYLNNHYGFAQEIYKLPYDNILQVGHSGGGPGYRCRFIRDLKNDTAIIVIVNTEIAPVDKLTEDISRIIYNKNVDVPVFAKINNEDLQKLEGIYVTDKETYYINIVDGTVIVCGGVLPRIPLIPISKTFYKLGDDFTFTFNNNSSDKIENITVFNLNGTKVAKKITSSFPWGIIGTATHGGWDGKDTVLETNPSRPNYYFLKNVKLNKGELRFRLNNDWSNSYGVNPDGTMVYDGYNIPVLKDGLYDIVLDLSNETKPKYLLKKTTESIKKSTTLNLTF